MKFINYINEENIEDTIALLEKDCQPYLNKLSSRYFLKHDLLISGRNESKNFITKDIRQDRKPRDVYPEIHEYIDKQFNKKFGIKARSQTLFCYSKVGDVSSYGNAYYIFPIGEFDVIWSKEWRDLYSTRPYMDLGFEKYKPFFKDSILNTYEKGNLKKAINSGNEIMLYCKSFKCYMLKHSWSVTHEIFYYFRDNL